MQPTLDSQTTIQFVGPLAGTVAWQVSDGVIYSAFFGGPPVPFVIEPGGSTSFWIEPPSISPLPGLNIEYNGPSAKTFFSLNSDNSWKYEGNESFICLDPKGVTSIAEICFTLNTTSDGILIVGTLDLGSGHGNG